ncbi:unnamed protein product [Parnassius apollo]|uniref:(apollo) hypothetical protein n=1 Tax=Parnassius apollo TaxID=110799 RepID=A0A8S3X5C8_PARAO|nr:unnamed protein product [Parnassius apollo]
MTLKRPSTQYHQVFTDKRNILKYRELSCFCKFTKRGFCICLNTKTYQVNNNAAKQLNLDPTKQIHLQILVQILQPKRHDIQDPSDEDVPLAVFKQIQNIPSQRSIYRAVHGSSSDSDDESQIDKKNRKSMDVDDKFRFQNFHVEEDQVAFTFYDKISQQVSIGDFFHVYGSNKKKNIYSYVCKALSSIEEDGEIKVMFLRVVSNDTKKFRVDKKDISYVNYEDVISILPVPSLLEKDMYKFTDSIDIFEK